METLGRVTRVTPETVTVSIGAGPLKAGCRVVPPTVHLTPELQQVVRDAIAASCRSPQQEQACRDVSAAVIAYLREAGVVETVLPTVRSEVLDLQRHLAEAQRRKRELQEIAEPKHLDAKGRRTLALTRALLDAYMATLSVSGAYSDANDALRTTAARCASFTVWAYLGGKRRRSKKGRRR